MYVHLLCMLNGLQIYLEFKQSFQIVLWKKDNSKLSEEIPKECLPEEYGGTEPSMKELRSKQYDYVQSFTHILNSIS